MVKTIILRSFQQRTLGGSRIYMVLIGTYGGDNILCYTPDYTQQQTCIFSTGLAYHINYLYNIYISNDPNKKPFLYESITFIQMQTIQMCYFKTLDLIYQSDFILRHFAVLRICELHPREAVLLMNVKLPCIRDVSEEPESNRFTINKIKLYKPPFHGRIRLRIPADTA